MRAKVPQDVQREDQILWFITLRQLVMLLIGFGISYLLFVNMKEKYSLESFEKVLIWFPAAISAAFAFLKIKGIPLGQFCTLIFEQFLFRRQKRWWIQGAGEPLFSLTTQVPSLGKKKKEKVEAKEFDRNKVHDLAQFLDGQKPVTKKSKP